MATIKAIRRRIASVNSTKQITRAMKLISAARLRRAQEALLNARPYSETLARVAASVLQSAESEVATKAAQGAKRSLLLAVISSDRGLAGGYNANLIRQAEEIARQKENEGFEAGFFVVGRKAQEHFKRAGRMIAGQSINNSKLATVGLAKSLAARMLSDFRKGEISEAGLVYSSFRSALTQRPVYERVLPVAPPKNEEKPDPGRPRESEKVAAANYLFEPSPEELIPIVLRSYTESRVFHALLEAEASEHGARMTAMDSATGNAVDMIERLTLEMNRARQATITKELMDIVGGAEALQGQA